MSADDAGVAPEQAAVAAEPIEVGWYAYSGGAQMMVFHLRSPRQWSAHFSNGTSDDCAWGYIEQALGVWDLVRIDPAALAANLPADDGARAALAEVKRRIMGAEPGLREPMLRRAWENGNRQALRIVHEVTADLAGDHT